MKNVINYYYNIIVNDFKKRENSFIFYIDGNEFEFLQFFGDPNKLSNLYSVLRAYRRECDQIIVNKNSSIITYYENIPYILLKRINHNNRKIELNDIINYDCNIHIKEDIKWKNLWENKLDYYEMQIEETALKYPLLKQSFYYYLGLSEIAINLLNYVNYDNINYCISHKRLDNANDLFNPINIIIDNKTRDIAEYIKNQFFCDNISSEDVIEFISQSTFVKDEILLLMARLIYPSYYFDVYEKIYREKGYEKDLHKLIKKNTAYEVFLKKIYNNIKFLYGIPQIEFLEY